MILTYLECAFQDEEFEYFWGSVRPSVQNLKISHAAKRPKAVGLDGPEGLDQCFFGNANLVTYNLGTNILVTTIW